MIQINIKVQGAAMVSSPSAYVTVDADEQLTADEVQMLMEAATQCANSIIRERRVKNEPA
jgi:GAF domain-containing protein